MTVYAEMVPVEFLALLDDFLSNPDTLVERLNAVRRMVATYSPFRAEPVTLVGLWWVVRRMAAGLVEAADRAEEQR